MAYFRLLCAGPILFLAFGCVLLWQAAAHEAAGRLEQARARARSAKSPAVGVLALSSLLVATATVPFPQRGVVPGLTATGASVALLAALSGKPRPSIYFATGLLAAAVVSVLVVR